MAKVDFEDFILNEGIVGFFDEPRTLKSGRTSHWYVNWRRVTNDVKLLDTLCDYILDFVSNLGLEVDTFYGVPEGATKTGLIAQYKWGMRQKGFDKGSHVLAMGRGKAKLHGDPSDRYFVGMPKGKTVVIEDVTTTGGSLVATIDQLKEAGIQVTAALGLTNRWEKPLETDEGNSVEQRIQKRFNDSVKYYSMSTAKTLLPKAVEKFGPGSHVIEALKKEYEQYGVSPIF